MVNTLAWDPWEELESLRGQVDRLFRQSLEGPREADGLRVMRPALAAWETQDDLRIEMDMPGVRGEDLDVEAVSRQVRVSGMRQRDGRLHGIRYERTIAIPEACDVERMSAEMRDGVLRLTVPKREQAKPRRIEVGSSAPAQATIEAQPGTTETRELAGVT